MDILINIPSISSVPKLKDYNGVSGPFATNSGFGDGDFKLGLTSEEVYRDIFKSGLDGDDNEK